ncbi:MAG TPA: ribonuclease HI [Hyphomicrobiaceae bacterium]|jgi:ribonuclease HI
MTTDTSGTTSEAAAGKPHITVYTDGACAGNPGPGGWGAILMSGSHRKELSGGEPATTNNRMELMAAISALEALKQPARVDMHTDSEYVQKGISGWIKGWKRNGWRTSTRQAVKNAELWQRLDAAQARHEVRWHWVRGHAGHTENERADELAREGMRPFLRKGRS